MPDRLSPQLSGNLKMLIFGTKRHRILLWLASSPGTVWVDKPPWEITIVGGAGERRCDCDASAMLHDVVVIRPPLPCEEAGIATDGFFICDAALSSLA